MGPEKTIDCPSDDAVLHYISGRLDAQALVHAEAHLDRCLACRRLVSTLLADATPATTIDRYVILRVLGAGSSGVVYAAYDPRLDRKVALKVLHATELGTSDSRLGNLAREAQAMARLEHPNVVSVYDVGVFDGRVYIAMALVEGRNLRRWLSEASRSWREVLAVFMAAGRGLAAVHAAGLLHCDFKPENVIVGEHGVWLTDFGLAANVEQVGETSRAGTPAYMAPEQLTGSALDARTDLFALSVALYEALYGQRPFHGATPEDLYRAVIAGPPRPPESKVPGWLGRAVLRGLATSPAKRPSSVLAFIGDVERRARRSYRGALAAVALLVLATLGTFAYRERTRCERGTDLVAAAWGARQQEILVQHLSSLPGGARAAALLVRGFDDFSAAFESVYRDACDDAGDDARYDERLVCLERSVFDLSAQIDVASHAEVSEAAVLVGRLPSPIDCLREHPLVLPMPRASELRTAIEGVYRQLAQARALDDAGHKRQARELLEPLQKTAEELAYAPLTAATQLQLGLSFFWDDPLAALPHLHAAGVLADAGRDDRVRAQALIHRASARLYLGQLHEADAALEEAQAVLVRMGDEPDLEALAEAILAKVAQRRARYSDAVEHATRALSFEQSRSGTSPAGQAPLLTVLCTMQALANAGEQALKTCQRAIDTLEALYGPEHPRLALAENGRGIALHHLSRFDEAMVAHERAIKMLMHLYGANHPMVAMALVARGQSRLALGQAGAALDDFACARRDLTERYGEDHPELVEALLGVADAERALGHYERSLRALAQARAIVARLEAKDEADATIDFLDARVRLERGEPPAAARSALLRAREWFSGTAQWHAAELRTIERLLDG